MAGFFDFISFAGATAIMGDRSSSEVKGNSPFPIPDSRFPIPHCQSYDRKTHSRTRDAVADI